MSGKAIPPSPRLMAVPALSELPGAPRLSDLPSDAIGELVVLGLSGDEDEPTAHVAVYVETPTATVEWVTMMRFDDFLGCIPSWALLNTPTSTADTSNGQRAPRRRAHSGQPQQAQGERLASAWRQKGRPVRATDQFLLRSIELVPDDAAITYLEAVRRLRQRKFDKVSRSLIAEVCELIASVQERLPEAS